MKNIILGLLFFTIPFLALSQWTQVPVPTTNGICAITFTDLTHGYASAYEYILKSNDGGNSWQIVANYPNLVVADLSFPTPDIGYAAGDNGLLLKTTDAGNTWFPLNSPCSEILRGVYFLNASKGFICGQREGIYLTEDGGLTWTQKTMGEYWLRQFSFPTPQIGYCAGDGLHVYKTTDGGATWNQLNLGAGDANITDVDFQDANVGYICRSDGYISKTVNGGVTWQTQNSGTTWFEGLWFFNANAGYVVGKDGTIQKTADGGATWTAESSGVTSILRRAFFFNPENGFICSMNGIILKKGCLLPAAAFNDTINGFTASFTNQSANAGSSLWQFGDGSSSSDENPSHTYASSGDYQVCLTVTNSCGSDLFCKTVHVVCTLPVSNFVYEPDFPMVEFSDSSVTGTLLSRIWDFGDGIFSTVATVTHEYAQPGTYEVCLTVTDSCGTDVSCQTVYYLLPMSLSIQAIPSESNDHQVQFRDETPGTSRWAWDFGDGSKSSLQNPLHVYKEYGTYQVCLTAGNQQYQGTACDTLLLKVIPALHEGNPVIVYPNPTDGKIFVRFFKKFASAQLLVQDMTGRTVYNEQLTGIDLTAPAKVDLSQLQSGVYFVSLKADGYGKTWKIVLE